MACQQEAKFVSDSLGVTEAIKKYGTPMRDYGKSRKLCKKIEAAVKKGVDDDRALRAREFLSYKP